VTSEITLGFGLDELGYVKARARRLLAEGALKLPDINTSHEPPAHDVTVIVPARNEAATIAAVVKAARVVAGEVIVVEGGSADETAIYAARAGARVVTDPGLGKGAAMRLAVQYVTTPFCVFVDADGSHDPIDIPRLVAPLRERIAEHVAGSRALGGSDELHGGFDEFLRLIGSALITLAINWRFSVRISDSQNGFRAFNVAFFRELDLKSAHTTIEMEMVMATLACGGRIAEVPTHERRRAAGYSKISLKNPKVWWSYGSTLLRGLCSPLRARRKWATV
jgi:glycosyltransferase involved in cell wall biosynthesis